MYNATPILQSSPSTGELGQPMPAMLIFEIRQKHPLAVDKAKHQCVKWEPLEHWMAEHSFDAFEQGLLVHPIYGDPYTGEKADTIGIALGDHTLEVGNGGNSH
ncbi:unnamed protein product [Penicillium crustosum]